MNNELNLYIKKIKELVSNPSDGIPEELFHFASCITAMVNVDLLIKNKKKQTLLTWRDDNFYGPGWHIPGGIIRFKEKLHSRINKVAKNELGLTVSFSKEPLIIKELFANKNRIFRGHFITFVFECKPNKLPDIKKKFVDGKPKSGQWKWHEKSPKNLIRQHHGYKKFIDNNY